MDSTAAEMAARQDESEASRRRLVELSREFKTKTQEVLNVSFCYFPETTNIFFII